MPFTWWNDYYYLVVTVQDCCIVHALKTGRREWVHIILFLPLAGAVAYFIREMRSLR